MNSRIMNRRLNTCRLPVIIVAAIATSVMAFLSGCASEPKNGSVVVEEACHQYWCDDELEQPEADKTKPEKNGKSGIKKMIRKDKAIPGLYHPLSDQKPGVGPIRSPTLTKPWP